MKIKRKRKNLFDKEELSSFRIVTNAGSFDIEHNLRDNRLSITKNWLRDDASTQMIVKPCVANVINIK